MAQWGTSTATALVGVTILATLTSLILGPVVVRSGRYDHAPSGGRRGLVTTPGFALLVVTALIYLNQALFTVYVIRVHGGDPSFIARYLPAGWFDLAADSPILRPLSEAFPAPELLAPTVLRVQAFLELPFVLLAYLTVCRWLDPGLYRRMAQSPLVWLASASYTATFCLIEWTLRNPYTVDDIMLRLVAATVVPPLIGWLARRDPAADRAVVWPPTATMLLTFAASAWAMGALVLTVYDTALLYNLDHLTTRLPTIGGAVAVLVVARLSAYLVGASGPARAPARTVALDTTISALRWFVVVFFVAALPVRYAAAEPTAQVAGTLTVLAATAAGAAEALRHAGPSLGYRPMWRTALSGAAQLAIAVLIGATAAYGVLSRVTAHYPETALLHAGGTFVTTAVVILSLFGWANSRQRRSGMCPRRGRSPDSDAPRPSPP